jgi:hypothetical protein
MQQATTTRDLDLTYSAMIAISLIILQNFFSTGFTDTPELVSVIAFAVALPVLALGLLTNILSKGKLEASPKLATIVGIPSAIIGIIAAFWHISWIAGVAILISGVVAMVVFAVQGWDDSWKKDSP